MNVHSVFKATAVACALLFAPPLHADPYLRQPIDVEHYRFALTLSDSSDRIVGDTQIRLRLLAAGVTQIVFDLADMRVARSGRGMHVSAVSVDGQALTFRHAADRIVIQLPIEIGRAHV